MNLTKERFEDILKCTLEEFNEKILKTAPVKLRYVSKEYMLQDAKNNPFITQLIRLKLINEEELGSVYPIFIATFPLDSSPITLFVDRCYYISICLELAQKFLSMLDDELITEFLKHTFAHELTHIYEKELANKYCNEYLTAKEEGYAWREIFAEMIACKIADKEKVDRAVSILWGELLRRAKM